MSKEVIVLIGLPGSGKSTWAKQQKGVILSADNYFLEDGIYKFDRTKLGEAHKICLKRFADWVYIPEINEYRPSSINIIVDNTNLSLEEISPYISLGQAYADNVRVLLFDCLPETSKKRNIHNVPENVIYSMEYKLGWMLNHWPKRWPKIEIINTEEVENEVRI